MKLLLELSAEDPLATVESFATQILQEDVLPLTARDFAVAVDSVTTDDVNQACISSLITSCVLMMLYVV